ncbi:MAG: hypothetical protein HC888_04740 [Candidatus Competibacteraceae bacterium]|nr:hypothetical protein [Candidatus Competibacteraceae bacterium]
MTIDLSRLDWNTISAISSILAFLAIILTLIEMRTQRKHTYLPVLVLSKPYFVVQNDGRGVPSIWKDSIEDSGKYGNMWVDLELLNIGFGPANEITIQWRVDKEEMSTRMKEVNKNGIFEVNETRESIHYTYKGYGFEFADHDADMTSQIPFVVNTQSTPVRLPMCVKSFISFYYLGLSKLQKGIVAVDTQMPLSVELSCNDLSGRRRHFAYKMRYSLYLQNDLIGVPEQSAILGRIFFVKR